jgi:galactoside O-acetyltransferase
LLLNDGKIITNLKNITIGSGFKMSPNCQLFAQGESGESTIVIGDNVALNFNVMINADCGGTIIIGNDVRIGPYTVMRAANHRFDAMDLPIYKQGHDSGQIIVEDDVWLGAHVTLLPNIKIGKSSIIGAGSVVTSDIPPFSIAAGIPAKVIKRRNE